MLSRDDARDYAARLIACQQFSWDTIAEGHPNGEILEQEDCDLVREALEGCTVVLFWDEPSLTDSRVFEPEDR